MEGWFSDLRCPGGPGRPESEPGGLRWDVVSRSPSGQREQGLFCAANEGQSSGVGQTLSSHISHCLDPF